MADLNMMPVFTDAYLADTYHLSRGDHGSYLLILMRMWREGASLPDDQEMFRKIAKCSPHEWAKTWPVLEPLLTKRPDGRWTQKKLAELYEKTLRKVAANRSNGQQGGRPPKPLENNDTPKANGSGSVSPNETQKQPDGTLSVSVSVSESIPPVVPPDGGNTPQQTAKFVRGKRSERVNGTRLSKDWKPSEENRDYAKRKGLLDKAIDAQAERFRNHWVSSSKSNAVKLDWDATWQNWILSSIERNPGLVTEAVTGGGEVSTELKERGWRIFLEREREGRPLPQNVRKEDIPQEFIDDWNAKNGGLFGKAKP